MSVFKWVCIPILTYSHESWLLTDKILSQMQAAKWDFCAECEVTQGRVEVRWRPGHKRSLAPPCLNLRSFGSKCSVLNKNVGYCWDLRRPHWFGTRGIVAPAPSLRRRCSSAASRKILKGPNNLWGGKILDFRQMTLFCFGNLLLKHKITICSENLGGHGPIGPLLATPMRRCDTSR